MIITFYKYQGTGNDFVLIDNRDNSIQLNKEQIAKICDRRFGVGADGLMLLQLEQGFDFKMVYYNADGAESSMCGNGGRCLVKFAHQMGIHKNLYKFNAVDGMHEAEIIEGNWVRLKMIDVHKVEEHDNHAVLNTGSPHYVKFVNNLEEVDVFAEGKHIRYNEKYAAQGINVNFTERITENKIFVRTYERGVENETYSCGTGVTAAALVSAHNERGFNQVEVKTIGGNLNVEYYKLDEENFSDIWLSGPATHVFTGTIN